MKTQAPIVITGFMGCGKSNVARALARRLDLAIVDLDQTITARTGRTPAQLIREEGEPDFRAIESQALRETLSKGGAGVVALGGGAWIQKENRDLIEQYSCISVWLDVPFEVCWARIETSAEDRPLGRNKGQASELYERRKPVYELAAIHISPRDHEDLESMVSRIAENLNK